MCTSAGNEPAALYPHRHSAVLGQPRSGRSAKRDIAVALLDADDIALSVQVLQEFYIRETRTTRRDALPHDIAVGLMRTWLRYTVQEITLPVMIGALEIKAIYRLSYWDAAIIAAARALGCRELLSDDMSHGRDVEAIRITDPFR